MIPPKEAIQRLIQGNERFTSGVRSVEHLLSHTKMKQLAEDGQKPFAIILTCSDSRSPAEMIFDQGIGELFVVRVAGNVIAPSLLASIEFAAANFGSTAIVVLGHTSCGAVAATIDHMKHPSIPLPSVHLEELIARIRPAVERCESENHNHTTLLEQSTVANIERSLRLILDQSEIIRKLYKDGNITLQGALLDIATGKVNFLNSL